MLHMMTMETASGFPIIKKYIYNDLNMFIFSWWITHSYFNNEQIHIDDI